MMPGPWLLRATGYALQGFAQAVTREPHTQLLVICAAVTMALGGIFRLSLLEWALVILSIGSVVTLELANTAIERVVDLASPQQRPLAKQAKDVAAAAVLVAIVVAAAVGLLVFVPHFLGRR